MRVDPYRVLGIVILPALSWAVVGGVVWLALRSVR